MTSIRSRPHGRDGGAARPLSHQPQRRHPSDCAVLQGVLDAQLHELGQTRAIRAEGWVVGRPASLPGVRCPLAVDDPFPVFALEPRSVGVVAALLDIAATTCDPKIPGVLGRPIGEAQRRYPVLDVQVTRRLSVSTAVEAEPVGCEQRTHDRCERPPVQFDEHEVIADGVAEGFGKFACEGFRTPLDGEACRVSFAAVVTNRLLGKPTVRFWYSGRLSRIRSNLRLRPVEVFDRLPASMVPTPCATIADLACVASCRGSGSHQWAAQPQAAGQSYQ